LIVDQRFYDICKMHILITAATSFEIQPLIDFLQTKDYKLQSHEISFLITGVGAVATTYHLTNEIFKNRPNIILQAGIAGCFTKHVLAETVIIKEDSFADLGVMENKQFKNIFDLQLANKNDFPFTNGILSNNNKNLLNLLSIEKVNGITVNEITTDNEKIKWHQQNSVAVVESMEGAAFHYVCLQQKIPFLQIRSISNYIGERDKLKWKIKESIQSLNQKLILLIEEISKHDETYFRI
jgi:futalosine hydrolase